MCIHLLQFSHSVVSDSLWHHGLQHTRLPCPSPTHVHWVDDAIQPSHPVSSPSPPAFNFPASGSFPVSQFFAPGGQSIGVSASASVLPMNIQDWLPLGFDLLAVQGTQESTLTHNSKASILRHLAFFIVQLSHLYMTTGKTIVLSRGTFVGKVMLLLFNILSRFVIAFLPRSECLLSSWLQSPSAVIFEPPQNKVCHCFCCFPVYLPWSDGIRCHDLSFFECWVLSQLFHSSLTFIKRLFSSPLLPAIRVVSSVYLRLLIFLPAILIDCSLCFIQPSISHDVHSTYN